VTILAAALGVLLLLVGSAVVIVRDGFSDGFLYSFASFVVFQGGVCLVVLAWSAVL
jgi:hypothetical protein